MPDGTKSRIAILKEMLAAAETAGGPTCDVPFQGNRVSLRKIRIKTDFLRYRIQSGRTHRAQGQYLDEHPDLPRHFFDDPEDAAVQAAQHQILLRMISEKELDKDLEDRGQTTPLVLTIDAFVVDGNRRLAALREAKEEYVEAVVLPETASNQEIYETEVELQMQRETKAPYNWIDQALHIEYGIQTLGESLDTVARRMRLDAQEVQRHLEKLNVVRTYLEWLGEPGKYHKVPADNTGAMAQAFEDTHIRLSTPQIMRKSKPHQDMIRDACFAAISKGAGYKEIRSLIRYLSQRPEIVLGRLRNKQPMIADTPAPTAQPQELGITPTDRANPLLELAEAEPVETTPAVAQLRSIFGDTNKANQAWPALQEIVEDLDTEDKDIKRAQTPLKLVQHAALDLEKVDLGPETEKLDEIAQALEQVNVEARRIAETIDQIHSEKSAES